MSDPRHPTDPAWVMHDPLEKHPPMNVDLLLIQRGGNLTTGYWTADCLAWHEKPKVPASVKERYAGK